MSKFGNIISQAKSGEASKPVKQKASKPEIQNTSNKESRNASNMASQNTGKPESGNSGKPENTINEKNVNLTIKVPETLRRHWSAEAKREGTSITAIVTEALNARFGKP